LGHALSLAALGRWQAARDWLLESTMAYPDRREYAIALARLLSAAPDARLRDGHRALQIASTLLKQQKSTDVGEALAMALAEIGDYDQAVGIQRGILTAAQKADMKTAVPRMTENLRLYERREPCRTPWPPNQPVILSESAAVPVSAALRR
jgi:hypothetical protein